MDLFFKITPEENLKFKGEKCTCGKQSKEWTTLLITANMTGKINNELMVIGKKSQDALKV